MWSWEKQCRCLDANPDSISVYVLLAWWCWGLFTGKILRSNCFMHIYKMYNKVSRGVPSKFLSLAGNHKYYSLGFLCPFQMASACINQIYICTEVQIGPPVDFTSWSITMTPALLPRSDEYACGNIRAIPLMILVIERFCGHQCISLILLPPASYLKAR